MTKWVPPKGEARFKKFLEPCLGKAAQAAASPRETAGQMCQPLKRKVDEEEKGGRGQR